MYGRVDSLAFYIRHVPSRDVLMGETGSLQQSYSRATSTEYGHTKAREASTSLASILERQIWLLARDPLAKNLGDRGLDSTSTIYPLSIMRALMRVHELRQYI